MLCVYRRRYVSSGSWARSFLLAESVVSDIQSHEGSRGLHRDFRSVRPRQGVHVGISWVQNVRWCHEAGKMKCIKGHTHTHKDTNSSLRGELL